MVDVYIKLENKVWVWWRWGELNPRPKIVRNSETKLCRPLRGYRQKILKVVSADNGRSWVFLLIIALTVFPKLQVNKIWYLDFEKVIN